MVVAVDRMLQLRIVVGALMAGAVSFLLVAAFLITSGALAMNAPAIEGPLIIAWAAVAGGSFAVWPLIRKSSARNAARAFADSMATEGREGALQHYSTATIVGAALAEGSCLLATTFGLITGKTGWLLMACLPLAVIAVFFPSEAKFDRFVARGRSGPDVSTPH